MARLAFSVRKFTCTDLPLYVAFALLKDEISFRRRIIIPGLKVLLLTN
jgi:hypothetical protein